MLCSPFFGLVECEHGTIDVRVCVDEIDQNFTLACAAAAVRHRRASLRGSQLAATRERCAAVDRRARLFIANIAAQLGPSCALVDRLYAIV